MQGQDEAIARAHHVLLRGVSKVLDQLRGEGGKERKTNEKKRERERERERVRVCVL